MTTILTLSLPQPCRLPSSEPLHPFSSRSLGSILSSTLSLLSCLLFLVQLLGSSIVPVLALRNCTSGLRSSVLLQLPPYSPPSPSPQVISFFLLSWSYPPTSRGTTLSVPTPVTTLLFLLVLLFVFRLFSLSVLTPAQFRASKSPRRRFLFPFLCLAF